MAVEAATRSSTSVAVASTRDIPSVIVAATVATGSGYSDIDVAAPKFPFTFTAALADWFTWSSKDRRLRSHVPKILVKTQS